MSASAGFSGGKKKKWTPKPPKPADDAPRNKKVSRWSWSGCGKSREHLPRPNSTHPSTSCPPESPQGAQIPD